ncbi:MAG: D-2-hydroxyacid dehydrogenase [Gemmatimonadaceae bacterium]|jgi:phosphoglycerate dehydrogenase-like enzyme|nr:D-2-hydroxyacid dehydrogenase [Gemmatimonadaceae bacterium]
MASPALFPVRRVVVGSTQHEAVRAALTAARPDLDTRGARYQDVTADDLAWADAYIGFKRPPVPTMGTVRWVHCTGAGVDAWFSPTELDRSILLTRSSESFGPMIAEWALARALAVAQRLREFDAAQFERRWAPRDPHLLRGTTAVIVGTGDVGGHCGRLFAALGCHVIGVSRTGAGDAAVFAERHPVSALTQVAARADWLLLMLPLTDDTRGLVTREVLAACRGAVLINGGRGAVVDEAAIPDALDAGWLRAAALDVFAVEPLPATSPLWADPRVIVSPHISGLTTVEGTVAGFLECLTSIEAGATPRWTVDRDRQY